MSQPWWIELFNVFSSGWLSNILGLLGIVYGGVASARSMRPNKWFRYDVTSSTIIDISHAKVQSDLKLSYKGQVVPRVATTIVRLWNAGTKTIEGSDVLPKDPIRVDLEPIGAVLATRISRTTRDVTGINIVENSGSGVAVLFDLLEPGDGCVIEITHTAETMIASVKGSVKGQLQKPRLIQAHGEIRTVFRQFARFMLAWILILAIWSLIMGVSRFGKPFDLAKFLLSQEFLTPAKVISTMIIPPALVLLFLKEVVPEGISSVKRTFFPVSQN